MSSTAEVAERRASAPPDDVPVPQKLYTMEQARVFLHLSARQMLRRVNAGAIGHVRPGKERLIEGQQILDYIEEHKVDPVPIHRRPRLTER